MKLRHFFLLLVASWVCLQGVHAQSLFKWIDAQGRVTYSDRPAPPGDVIKDVSATMNTMGAGEAQTGSLGFEAQQVANRSPVTLYAAKGCPPCDEGRALLRKRGVPYSEKLIESEGDLKAMQEKFSVQTLPVMTVGSNARKGFSSLDWDSALDAAGYAKENNLPKGFATGKVEKLTAPAASSAAAGEPPKRPAPAPAPTSAAAATDNKPSLRF